MTENDNSKIDPYANYRGTEFGDPFLIPKKIDTSVNQKVIDMLEKFIQMVPEVNDPLAENTLLEILNKNLEE